MVIRGLSNQDRTRYRAIEVYEQASHTTHEISEDEEMDNTNFSSSLGTGDNASCSIVAAINAE